MIKRPFVTCWGCIKNDLDMVNRPFVTCWEFVHYFKINCILPLYLDKILS